MSTQGSTVADAPCSALVPAQRDHRHQDVVTARQVGAGQLGFVGTERVQPNVDAAQIPAPQQPFHRPVGAKEEAGGSDARTVTLTSVGGAKPPLLVRRPELSFWVLPQKKGHCEEDVFKI